MEEKILNTRKNGMAMLLLTLLGYVVAIALFIYSITLLNADRMLLGVPLLILSIAYWIAGIFLFCGLKVLKPQGRFHHPAWQRFQLRRTVRAKMHPAQRVVLLLQTDGTKDAVDVPDVQNRPLPFL